MSFNRNFRKYWLLFLVFLIIICSSYYSYSNEGIIYLLTNGELEGVIDYIEGFGALGPLVLVIITTIEVVVAPIPALILYVAAGLAYGAFFGGTLVLIGNILGAGIAFYIARTFGREYIERKINNKSREKFDRYSEKYGVFGIFFLRLNPFTSSDAFSYLSGLTKMRFSSFIIGTSLGLVPLIYVQAYIGESLVKTNPLLYSLFLWVSIVYILAFGALIGYSLWKK